MDATEQLRLTSETSNTIVDMIMALSGGNTGAVTVLTAWAARDFNGALLSFMTSLDLKHLYDERIWEVYKDVCDSDLDRFIYHVQMELPNQVTGQHSMSGRYIDRVNPDTFASRRRFGKPGSYWALEQPPTESDYIYPLF